MSRSLLKYTQINLALVSMFLLLLLISECNQATHREHADMNTRVVCRNALPDKSWFKEGVLAKELPIQVDEDEQTVTVEGGVQTRVLLDYLAHFMYDPPPADAPEHITPDCLQVPCSHPLATSTERAEAADLY